MSDLHCPATLILSTLTRAALAEEPSSGGGGSLASGEKLAAVWCSDPDGPVRELATRLGVGLSTAGDLRPTTAEPDEQIALRCRHGLEEIADLHRGETVLVVLDERALGLAVRALTGVELSAPSIALTHDQDGWVLADPS